MPPKWWQQKIQKMLYFYYLLKNISQNVHNKRQKCKHCKNQKCDSGVASQSVFAFTKWKDRLNVPIIETSEHYGQHHQQICRFDIPMDDRLRQVMQPLHDFTMTSPFSPRIWKIMELSPSIRSN